MSVPTLDAADKLTRGNIIAVKISPLEVHLLDKDGTHHRRLLCPYCRCLFASYGDREAHFEKYHKDEESVD
ncbi:MAG: hypothetical protein NTV61_06180 [Candidatus Bathyarchaeota archaeon]|nr:hypothetical protein [Candidatus Bathyarchaeota archaeon]